MKTCTHCHVEKPLTQFPPNPNTRDGLQSWCRACYAAYQRERRSQPGGRAQDRARTRARGRALEELARLHADDFERLLDRERVVEGLPADRWARI